MTLARMNKHELKTRETRALLIAAADTIFVRDGYDGAELGEIAALAGRTKGAIYAQFASKEDIFLALIEERARRYREEMEELFTKSTSVDANIAALRSFYLKRADDQAWNLLFLEFKLFAMRHPESKKRLQDLYARIHSPNNEKRLAEILGAAGKGKRAISRVEAIQALQPMISGLVLEAQLGTNLSEKNAIKRVTNRVFDALLEASTL